MSHRVGVLALTLCAACSVDLTDPLTGPTVMTVTAAITDSLGTDRLNVSGRLVMGPSTWDTADPLADSVLRAAEIVVQPVPNDFRTEFLYAAESSVGTPAPGGILPIGLPRVVGTTPADGAVTVAVPVIVGSRQIVLGPGEDLVLTTAVPGQPGMPAPESGHWRLEARQGSNSLVVQRGERSPPATITIPASWLDGFSQSFTVVLVTGQVVEGENSAAQYQFRVTVETRLHWVISR